jgi:threonine synthase
MSVRFRSTNKNAPLVSFKDALLKGQAPDYGLYMPTEIPQLGTREINSFKGKDYHEIAFEIVSKYMDDIDKADLCAAL